MDKIENNDIPHVNVFICTPGSSLMSQYVKSLIATTHYLGVNKISWAYSNEYSSVVADAREITLSGTKENNISEQRPFNGMVTYDKLFWIDSDISWTPEDFAKLYESDKDIISGAYLATNGDVMAHEKILGRPFRYDEIKPAKRLIKIESCGFGFLAIKSGVFESMTRPWFQPAISEIELEDGSKRTIPIMGEDVSFCKRALENGFELWLDPTVQVTHNKTMMLSWEGVRPL